MAKGKLWDEVTERLKKALGGGNDDVDPDKLEQGTDSDDDGDDKDKKTGEELEDAGPVLKALSEHIEKIEEANEIIAKSLAALAEQNTKNAALQKSIGEGLLAVMDQTRQIAEQPAPRRSAVSALDTMLKGGFTGAGVQPNTTATRHGQFTPADMDEAKDILCKAVSDGKLTTLEAGRAETQINKSIQNATFQIDPKFVSILRGSAQA